MSASVQGQIRAFLEQRLRLKGDASALADNEPLFSESRLDSLDAVETIMFLEGAFGLNFADIDYDLTLLDSVDAIGRVVEQKGATRAA
jgi:acyl carrier protein